MPYHDENVESGGQASAKVAIHIEGCTITTDGSIALFRIVVERLRAIAHRRRNDNIEPQEVFAYALDAVEEAIVDAIAEREGYNNTSTPSGMNRPLNRF